MHEFSRPVVGYEPLVSVIIPTYNGERYISETLKSVVEQTYPNLEIIVVDDASTDGTLEALKPFIRQIKLVERKVNGGVAAARNTGIKASSGDIVALLDQDDLWLPERLSKGVEAFFAKPGAGLVAVNTFIENEMTGDRARCWKRVVRTGDRVTKRLLAENFICSAGVLISRRALDEVGLFDEAFYGADDYDMWYRIARHFDFVILEEPLAVWRYRPSSLSSDTRRMLKDVIYFYDKVLEVEERPEERRIAAGRRSELMFKLGLVQSLQGDDAAARKTFKALRITGAPSLEASLAIGIHSVSPALFRTLRRFRSHRKPPVPVELELVI
ncbi:MAG: glycosyltransferase family 2 protein [Candidatus Aquicultorales bacterium]